MPFSHLSKKSIADIKQAFSTGGVPYDSQVRGLLLAGIDFAFVASLRTHKSDQFQLSGDLNSLNSIERLADGTVPLQTWLENAIDQFAPRVEGEVFERALDELRSDRPDLDVADKPSGGLKTPQKGFGEPREIKQSIVENVRSDIVNQGFSSAEAADKFRPKNEPLKCGESYYFWLNVGYEMKESIGPPQPLYVENLPSEARLKVALFSFEDELVIEPGHDIGELQIKRQNENESNPSQPPRATVKVTRQPIDSKDRMVSLSPDAAKDMLDRFLFFPIRASNFEKSQRLRCNIYCGQALVQSHLITARVMEKPVAMDNALGSQVDYALSPSLRPTHLAAIESQPHRLSLMLNSDGNGSHNFRFFGTDGDDLIKDDVNLGDTQLKELLQQARRAMRRVSWGDDEEWGQNNAQTYRYEEETFDAAKLAKDLAYLARAGWRIYAGFRPHLEIRARELEKLMAQPGMVQIALKMTPRAVLPAAVLYDYHWKPDQYEDFDETSFELCPTFAAAIEQANNAGPSLEESNCFKGRCHLKSKIDEVTKPGSKLTLKDLPAMICPSGFWGYRHELGLPFTLSGTESEAPIVIHREGPLRVYAGVSTDPAFEERDPHLDRVKMLGAPIYERGEDYDAIVKHLKANTPHLLYFYCHGGIRDNNLPYLEVGEKDRFDPADMIGEGIVWEDPHPLVFINGCHTTSLNPEITLDFVSSFVREGEAAGVIGTEITIFEKLAVRFAEECLTRFLTQGMTIGKAVRAARLELLRRGNPLGLVYIPFAMATLRLQQAADN